MVFSLILLWRGVALEAAFTAVIAVAWMVLLLTTFLAPSINRIASMRTVAGNIASNRIAPDELAVYYLHRNQVYGLGFYLKGLPQEWTPKQPSPRIGFVAAREDIAVDDLWPGARSLSLFPGQRMRLWTLGAPPPSEPMPASWPPAPPPAQQAK